MLLEKLFIRFIPTILYFTKWFQIFKYSISFPIKPLNFTFNHFIIHLSSPKVLFLITYPILQIWIDWSNRISFCEEFVHFSYLFVVSQFVLTKSHFEGFFVTFYSFSLKMRSSNDNFLMSLLILCQLYRVLLAWRYLFNHANFYQPHWQILSITLNL